MKNVIFLADLLKNHLFCGFRSAISKGQNFVVVNNPFGGIALAAARAIKMKKMCSHCSGKGEGALGATTIIIYKTQ